MKTSIEILKMHQAWRTHQCDSDGIEGCGKVECKMPITTPSELTDAIDDVIKDAERYHKIRDMDFKKFTALGTEKKYGDLNFDDTVDAI